MRRRATTETGITSRFRTRRGQEAQPSAHNNLAAVMSQLRETELSSPDDRHDVLELKEGAARIHLRKDQGVFYNPVQCFNRDISTAVINEYLRQRKDFIVQNKKTWDRRGTILEALAASGLRSIRYALEIDPELLREVVANDISNGAVESIKRNAELNGVADIVRPNLGDAILFMHQCKAENRFFDVVDLDPYGCAAQFLDPAVQVVQNGGLLCVTATDMAILCGNTPETCRAKYGSVSLRGKFCHEMALRILLYSIESAANRYSRYTTPLLSISVDFYIRVFVRIETSAQKVKASTSKLSLVYSCNGCGNFHFQPMGICSKATRLKQFTNARGPPVGTHCENCGSAFTLGGPIWTDPIHDSDFVAKLQQSLQTSKQLELTELPDFEAQGERSSLSQCPEGLLDCDAPPNCSADKEAATCSQSSVMSINNNTNVADLGNTINDTNASSSGVRGKQNGDVGHVYKRGMFQTLRRMQGIVNVISEELMDVPLHHTQEKLSQVLRTHTVPMVKLRSALLTAGYRVSLSHTNRTSVKTDAPHNVVWDIMRYWVKSRNDSKSNMSGVCEKIMSHEIRINVDLSQRADAIAPSMKDKSLRYQNNPERNWGPKARATATDDIDEKRRRLQGKKKRHKEDVEALQTQQDDANPTESANEAGGDEAHDALAQKNVEAKVTSTDSTVEPLVKKSKNPPPDDDGV